MSSPSLKISTPFAAMQQRLIQAKNQIQSERRELLQAVGVTVLALNQADYRVLSRGGSASDGRRWPALDPKTEKRKAARGRKPGSKQTTATGVALPSGGPSSIGIDTGLQFSSGSPGYSIPGGGNIFEIGVDSVKVGYGRSYSKYFDIKRKLVPDTLPEGWQSMLNKVVQQWMQQIIDATIGS